MKIYVPWALTGADEQWIDGYEKVYTVEEADIIVYTGGADISPELYGCEEHPRTHASRLRDREEVKVWNKIRPDQLVVGICRGAQLVTALNGGKLIQDVYGHAGGNHIIVNMDKTKKFDVTSLHHQMMYPFDMDPSHYEILYISEYKRSYERDYKHMENEPVPHYLGDKVEEPPVEPEVVLYHVPGKPVCLAIQGHPEMMYKTEPLIKELNNIIQQLL